MSAPIALIIVGLTVFVPGQQVTPAESEARAAITRHVREAADSERRGDVPAFRAAITKAAAVAGRDRVLLRGLAGALADVRLFSYSVQVCQQILSTDPEDAGVNGVFGIALKGLRRWEESLVAFDRALAKMPDQAVLLAHRAQTHIFLAHNDLARKDLQRARALSPDHPLVLGIQAELDFRVQDFASCVKTCEALVAAHPRDTRGITLLVRVLRALGRGEAALAAADAGLKQLPSDPEVLLVRGEALLALDRTAEAVVDLESVVKLRPTDHRPYQSLPKAYHKLGRKADAQAAQKRFHELKPRDF